MFNESTGKWTDLCDSTDFTIQTKTISYACPKKFFYTCPGIKLISSNEKKSLIFIPKGKLISFKQNKTFTAAAQNKVIL